MIIDLTSTGGRSKSGIYLATASTILFPYFSMIILTAVHLIVHAFLYIITGENNALIGRSKSNNSFASFIFNRLKNWLSTGYLHALDVCAWRWKAIRSALLAFSECEEITSYAEYAFFSDEINQTTNMWKSEMCAWMMNWCDVFFDDTVETNKNECRV